MHKRHHAHTDTPNDPHSPVHIKNIISFNLATVVEYRKLVNDFAEGKRSDSTVPRWAIMEKIAESLITRAVFILLPFFNSKLAIYIFAYSHNDGSNTWIYC